MRLYGRNDSVKGRMQDIPRIVETCQRHADAARLAGNSETAKYYSGLAKKYGTQAKRGGRV